MPVVITDFTNRTWAVEQPNDGYLHVGFTGEQGPRLLDILEFVQTRQKQFEKFLARKRTQERKDAERQRSTRVIVQQR